MAVPLKIEHRIHHVFQHTRTSHHAFLCHMSDDKNGNSKSLSDLHQGAGRFPHLRDASRCRRDVFIIHRLNGVNHDDLGLLPVNHAPYGIKIGLTEQT